MALKIPLRLRFVLSFTLLVIILMVLVVGVVEERQRNTFLEESRKRGISIAKNLAAVSVNSLLTYNYIVLKQNAEKASREDDIAYIIILDKEGKIAAFSGADEKEGMTLTDDISKRAASAPDVLVQRTLLQEKGIQVLDVAVPVFVEGSGEKWGLVRVGLSLESMFEEIAHTRAVLAVLALAAMFIGWIGSFFLSRRITRPLEGLVGATIAAAKGNLNQKIDVSTGDEIEELAHNFNHMIREVVAHRSELERRFKEISSLKRYNDNVLTSMANGLITLGLDGKIVTINKSGEYILGLKGDEVLGKNFKDVFCGNERIAHLFREGIDNNKSYSNIEIDFHKGEEGITLSLNISLLYDGEGEKIGVLIVFEDLTEIKALQEKMRHADRLTALGIVSAGLAHEIRNPLSTVKTFVQLLPKKIDKESFLEKFNITVPKELNRMNNIIENLLDLARKPKLKFVPIKVNSLLEELIEIYSTEMESKDISINASLHPETFPVSGNYEYLKRAFTNIFLNAFQAMPQGGSLLLETLPQTYSDINESPLGVDKAIKIVFKDSGIGMEEDTIKNLFNPFYSTKEKGTGLGLVIVQKIIEEHKGCIEVESELKKGSNFTILLPAIIPNS